VRLIRQSSGKIREFRGYGKSLNFYKGLIKLWDNGIECCVSDLNHKMVVFWGSGDEQGDVVDVRIGGLFNKHLSIYTRRGQGQKGYREYDLDIPQSEFDGWKQDIERAIRSFRGF
jgi:hypothetical protein